MAVQNLIGKQFWTIGSEPCWNFCQRVYAELGKPIPRGLQDLDLVESRQVGDVVLFAPEASGEPWHSGVVWPDLDHFAHCMKEPGRENMPALGRQDKLTDERFASRIGGYYRQWRMA